MAKQMNTDTVTDDRLFEIVDEHHIAIANLIGRLHEFVEDVGNCPELDPMLRHDLKLYVTIRLMQIANTGYETILEDAALLVDPEALRAKVLGTPPQSEMY